MDGRHRSGRSSRRLAEATRNDRYRIRLTGPLSLSGSPPRKGMGAHPQNLRQDACMDGKKRFFAYGLTGWCAEVLFTGLHDYVRHRDNRLPARTSLWMFPIYGLIRPLFEPLHRRLNASGTPAPVRAAAYGAGFFVIEYASGRTLRALLGEAPWDYSDAWANVHGLIRLDYFPYWAAAGLALEHLHDALEDTASN